MSTYWEQLRDPRWQRKRLEVMERAGFACEECYCTEKTLNVHHTYYAKGRKPWEYENESLKCLCEDCHGNTEALLNEAKRSIGMVGGFRLEVIVGFIRAMSYIEHLGEQDPGIPLDVGNEGIATGIADGFSCTVDDVLECFDPSARMVDGLALLKRAWARKAQRQVHDAIEHLDKQGDKGPDKT